MSTRERYEQWFRDNYKSDPMPELGHPAHDFCYEGWKAGANSADADVKLLAAESAMMRELVIFILRYGRIRDGEVEGFTELAKEVFARVSPRHCMCESCKYGTKHASDCALHSAPAYGTGPCDCGAIPSAEISASGACWYAASETGRSE